uniref:SH3 domain-containing protein n=1 Tax=Caenorhabditis japonica TaxID=281687 RepID=A0A8R1DUA9_CAEJA
MQVENFDPYTPGQLTKNFTATVADEISVTRGTTVKALYRDDQWIYVQVSDGRKGFVPQTHCKLLLNDKNGKRGEKIMQKIWEWIIDKKTNTIRKWRSSNIRRNNTDPDDLSGLFRSEKCFSKVEICEAPILHGFTATAPDDLGVREGETITILNVSDPEWIYVRNSENQSGFVPASHVKIPEDVVINRPTQKEKWENENLLVVEPYSARSPLDLTVRPGEWVKCIAKPIGDWLWAIRISDEKQGFVPNKVVILATDL